MEKMGGCEQWASSRPGGSSTNAFINPRSENRVGNNYALTTKLEQKDLPEYYIALNSSL